MSAMVCDARHMDRFCHLFSCCSAIFRMFNPRRLGGAYMCQWTGRQCISGTNNYLLSVGLLQIVLWNSWWRHPMETFSALLAICAGNSPVPGEFPTQRPVTQSFDVFFNLRLNKRLSKQSWDRAHYDVIVMFKSNHYIYVSKLEHHSFRWWFVSCSVLEPKLPYC